MSLTSDDTLALMLPRVSPRTRARRAWHKVRRAAVTAWPALVGIVLGLFTALALWCLFLLWWMGR